MPIYVTAIVVVLLLGGAVCAWLVAVNIFHWPGWTLGEPTNWVLLALSALMFTGAWVLLERFA